MRVLYKVPTPDEAVVTIYALIEPGTEHTPDPHVRYIGQTYGKLETRLSQHIADAKAGRTTNEKLRAWIIKCLNRKTRPVVWPVETTTCFSADETEGYHISAYAERFPDLLNLQHNPNHAQPRPFTEQALHRVGAA